MFAFKTQTGHGQFGRWIRMFALLAACANFLFSSIPVSAQSDVTSSSSDETLAELLQRLDKLEQDNRELRQALSRASDDPFIPLTSNLMIAGVPPTPDEGQPTGADDQDNLMQLLDGSFNRISAETNTVFDAQNSRLSAMNSELDRILKKKPTEMTGSYQTGALAFASKDGNFKARIGGTVQLDFIAPETTASGITGLGGPNTNLTQDSTDFRRIRSRLDGSMYGWIDWVFESELSSTIQNTSNPNAALPDNGLRNIGALNGGRQGGNTQNFIVPANMYVIFRKVPALGNIRVGNQFDWLSMDHLAGGRFNDFMERAPMFDVLTGGNNNGFTPGVSVFNNTPDKLAGLQLGVYKNNVYDSTNTFSVGNAFTYGGRAVWTPYYDEESSGRYMVHTAFGAEYRTFDTTLPTNQNGENIRIRSRGDLRIVAAQLTPNFIDTGNFFVTDQALIDPEFAMSWGPLTLQAEYTTGWFYGARTTQLAGGKPLNDVMVSSGYGEALYFLTGENKIYDRERGVFGQVIPKNNFKPTEGKYGAWQLGVRYDYTNANSGLITGGRNQNGTLGLNWFLNPHVRFQFNTVFSYIDNAVSPVIAGPVGSAATGTLQGSKLTGEGLIMTLGTRMDINF